MALKHPLTEQHKASLAKVLEGIPDMIELAQACKDCGLPTDDYLADAQRIQATAKALKDKFFPEG